MDFADEVIKEQVVNVLAILDTNMQETHVFENILISRDSKDTVVPVPDQYRGKILAYVLNFNELAYGIFYPDPKSISFFERHLGGANSAMLQLTTITQFFALM